jgi:hypothetical protein
MCWQLKHSNNIDFRLVFHAKNVVIPTNIGWLPKTNFNVKNAGSELPSEVAQ